MIGKHLWVGGAVVLLGWAYPAAGQDRAAAPGQAPLPAGVKALRDLEYVKGGHERQKLDLYLPENANGPLPVIVWIHGGGWRQGSKDRCPAVSFGGKGYAVASVNYRLSQHAKFPAQIEDCKAAIRWLRANAAKYHFDPEHIGVWGASAGGHLVALLGTTADMKELEGKEGNLNQSSRVQAVVDWFGPADFRNMGGSKDSPVARLLGGPVSENKEKAALASPVAHVSKNDPPFLIMQGDMDPLVPLAQSELLADALKKAGVDVTLQVLKGAKHGGPEFSTPESRKLIADFFDKHLKKGAPK
jgi:acetyl esterase/lipase